MDRLEFATDQLKKHKELATAILRSFKNEYGDGVLAGIQQAIDLLDGLKEYEKTDVKRSE